MRFVSNLGLITLLWAPLAPPFLRAQPTPAANWQAVRNHQPAALHLKLTLPKDHFFQGEEIDATLDYSNDDGTKPYEIEMPDMSENTIFHAADEKGVAAINPRGWYYDWYPMASEGPVQIEKIGHFTNNVAVNETVRFDRPGIYRLYAQSGVELADQDPSKSPPRVDLVSDQKTVTIVPRTPDEEKAVIADAMQKIVGDHPVGRDEDADVRAGIRELGYLQTSAARDLLIPMLGSNNTLYDVSVALESAPKPAAEAAEIFRQVQAGKLTLTDSGAEIYAVLKTSSLIHDLSPQTMPDAEAQKLFTRLFDARKVAQREVLEAALRSTGGQGPAYLEALWAAFQEQAIHKNPGEPDPDGGKARAALAVHQLELPETHVKELLNAWTYWGSADFLPLLQREAGPPVNDTRAQIALAGLKPDDMRSKIIAELSEPDSPIFKRSYPASIMLGAIEPMPLPQFDALFRAKLADAKADPFPIIPVIAAFGSPALLPDVVKAYRAYGKTSRGNWDDAELRCLFRYWLRCDPPDGAAAMEAEIESRGRNGWSLLDSTFRDPWTDDALPVVKWALRNPNPVLVSQAIFLLEKHGDESCVDPILAALERLRADKDYLKYVPDEAGRLLKSTRWHYTGAQKQRLETLAAGTPNK